jgi:hypothetical protein
MKCCAVCHYLACQRIYPVKSPFEQRRRKYCSRRCAGLAVGGVWRIPTEAKRAAAKKAAQINRQKAMARLADLSPWQIWRKAWSAGWKSGVRYARRCAA